MFAEHPQTLKLFVMAAFQLLQTRIAFAGNEQLLIGTLLKIKLVERVAKQLCRELPLQDVGIDGEIRQTLISRLVRKLAHGADRKASGMGCLSPQVLEPACLPAARSWHSPRRERRRTEAQSALEEGWSERTALGIHFETILELVHPRLGLRP